MLTPGRLYLLFDQFEENERYKTKSKEGWLELYDPDIDHLFNSQCLPPQIWHAHDLASTQVIDQLKILAPNATEEEKEQKLTEITRFDDVNSFGFYVWSKERFDERLSDEELMRKFKKRFDKNLPLKYINLVFLHSLEPNEQLRS